MRKLKNLLALCVIPLCVGAANVAQAVTVDLLVFYNTPTKTRLNNNPDAAIKGWVTQMNNTYADGKIDIQIRLVGAVFRETQDKDMGAALSELRGDQNAASIRSQLGADMVVQLASGQYCGLAYQALSANLAFSVVAPGCGYSALIHELGHNMGLAHARRQGDNGGAVYRYGIGHTVDNVFATIMAYGYSGTPEINKFSDPTILCKGIPCGVAAGQANESDSVLALNNSKARIAAWQPTKINPPTSSVAPSSTPRSSLRSSTPSSKKSSSSVASSVKSSNGNTGSSSSTGNTTNLAVNSGFESADLGPWSKWNDTSVVADNANSGTYALRLNGLYADSRQVIAVKPSTTYVLSAYFKSTQGEPMSMGLKGFSGGDVHVTVSSTSYKKGEVKFTTGAQETQIKMYLYHDGPSNGTGYVDDVLLAEVGSTGTSTKVEAESATVLGNTHIYDDSIASNTKALGWIDGIGNGFILNDIQASSSFTIRYSSIYSGTVAYYVNGVKAGNINFTSTGAFRGAYATTNIAQAIPAGAQFKVQFEAGNKPINVDFITFMP
jgi:hypothetical protein